MSPATREALRDERGTITLYLLGLVVLAVTLVAGVTAVTAAHLARIRLLDVADGAALAAAGGLDDSAYTAGVGEAVPLSEEAVARRAADYVAGHERPANVLGWQLGPGTGTPDGHTAVVDLTGEARLPLVGGLLRDLGVRVSIHVTSRARADVGP
ncbi:hypothetical protein H9L10_03010 [Phycicoccus endophyticus]|uniref:Putative Flp pilus-assembly TadG-like N-terminal domain-containing protein n=1 Tax=Phycicoccus endophyticus TaxID=1690220 RepID=A0A7G9R384_9MICO|nr:pilus assembly protein TadG-related protein [Phycicoccus endophyticus]NHI19801.1 hypothetical protein [Phycicoccus endophyticus]QNN50059.1 hypothetical protein H9L10_03010 [Phycicoccus endophyticus]GGL28480.1 hypothetical protein GCM10012283_08370 [Phycicoccus endophyticus]